jgi:heat shock protein HtpX
MRPQLRLYLLLGIMLGILYAVIVLVPNLMGIGGFVTYAVLAVGMVAPQYFIGPTMVSWVMKVRNVSEAEEPELHQMVSELAMETGIKKPKVCVSELDISNAFAYGRSQSDGAFWHSSQHVAAHQMPGTAGVE